MKAEHRKELETNALAEGMGRVIRNIKKGPKSQSRWVWLILLGVVLLVAGIALWIFLWSASSRSQSETWAKLDISTDYSSLLAVGYEIQQTERGLVPGSPIQTAAGRSARFQFAWLLLYQDGIRGLTETPDRALHNIMQAKDMFEKLKEEVGKDHVLVPECLYAIAVAEECLAADAGKNDAGKSDKQIKAAIAAYRELSDSDEFKNSALGREAAKRVAALSAPNSQAAQFYTELSRTVEQKRQAELIQRQFQEFMQKQQLNKK